MRGGPGPLGQDFGLHRGYVFAPTHSLHSELCMVLQVRYFVLPEVDFANAAGISPGHVAREITL